MSFYIYRFEWQGIGIYEAVDKHCPPSDSRRQSKPDGSWLPKVGRQYPGAVSYWTEEGLKKYISSSLLLWHCLMLPSEVTVLVAELPEDEGSNQGIVYKDQWQMICSRDKFSGKTTTKNFKQFAYEKAWQWIRSKQSDNDLESAIDLLNTWITLTAGDDEGVSALLELAGAYDFSGDEYNALLNYKRVLLQGVEKLPHSEICKFYVQYGSTLRNNLEVEESIKVLTEGIKKCPDQPILKVFLALSEYTAGNIDICRQQLNSVLSSFGCNKDVNLDDKSSLAALFDQVIPQDELLSLYSRAIKFYLQNLDLIPYRFRPATNADSTTCRKLIFDVLIEYGLEPDPDNTDADLNDIEANYINNGGMFEIVESVGLEPVLLGTVALFPLSKDICELRKMYLHKNARGLGLGKELLKRAIGRAKELGYKRIELETASALKEAIAMYKKYGFKEICKAHLPERCDQAYALDLCN